MENNNLTRQHFEFLDEVTFHIIVDDFNADFHLLPTYFLGVNWDDLDNETIFTIYCSEVIKSPINGYVIESVTFAVCDTHLIPFLLQKYNVVYGEDFAYYKKVATPKY